GGPSDGPGLTRLYTPTAARAVTTTCVWLTARLVSEGKPEKSDRFPVASVLTDGAGGWGSPGSSSPEGRAGPPVGGGGGGPSSSSSPLPVSPGPGNVVSGMGGRASTSGPTISRPLPASGVPPVRPAFDPSHRGELWLAVTVTPLSVQLSALP